MAKKNDIAAKDYAAANNDLQRRMEAAYDSARQHRQMSSQFHVIGELLGWRGCAADLARTGVNLFRRFAEADEQRCKLISDEIDALERKRIAA